MNVFTMIIQDTTKKKKTNKRVQMYSQDILLGVR